MGADGGFWFVGINEGKREALLELTKGFPSLDRNMECRSAKDYWYTEEQAPDWPFIEYGCGTDVDWTKETPADVYRGLTWSISESEQDGVDLGSQTLKQILEDALTDEYIWAASKRLDGVQECFEPPSSFYMYQPYEIKPAHKFVAKNFFMYTRMKYFFEWHLIESRVEEYVQIFCDHLGHVVDMTLHEFCDALDDCLSGKIDQVETWT